MDINRLVSMRQEELFETEDAGYSIWTYPKEVFRTKLMQEIARNPLIDYPDHEVVGTLAILARNELVACGNGDRQRLNDDEFRTLLRASISACQRIDLAFPTLPFQDFTGFRSYWKSQGWVGGGSYATRREFIQEVFRQLEFDLFEYESKLISSVLIEPIEANSSIGWMRVDSELLEVRKRFSSARTEQDFCAVGLACTRVLECLGEKVFDPDRYLPDGVETPPRAATKNRLEYVINVEVPGPSNDIFRKVARSTIELDQAVKHRKTPTRTEAAIACDATIFSLT
jgi:hypothetical protein